MNTACKALQSTTGDTSKGHSTSTAKTRGNAAEVLRLSAACEAFRIKPVRVVILADSGALAPRLTEEITTLLATGYQVLVVKVIGSNRPPVLEHKGNGYCETHIQTGSAVGWRMIMGIPPLYVRLFRMFWRQGAEVFHVGHLFLLPFALALSRWKGAKVVYDAYEFHAITWARYVPVFRTGVQRLLESIENRLASKADCVLTVDSVGRTLEKRFRRYNSNVTVLFNVPRRSRASNEARVEQLKARFSGSELVVYAGGIS